MNRRFFFPIILVGLLTLSFTMPTHERVDDPGLYLEVVGGDFAYGSFTLPEEAGVICGFGFGATCEVNLGVSLDPGYYPAYYEVTIYRNGSILMQPWIRASGYDGTYFSATFTGIAGDTFAADVQPIIRVGKDSTSEGGYDAAITVGMGL